MIMMPTETSWHDAMGTSVAGSWPTEDHATKCWTIIGVPASLTGPSSLAATLAACLAPAPLLGYLGLILGVHLHAATTHKISQRPPPTKRFPSRQFLTLHNSAPA